MSAIDTASSVFKLCQVFDWIDSDFDIYQDIFVLGQDRSYGVLNDYPIQTVYSLYSNHVILKDQKP